MSAVKRDPYKDIFSVQDRINRLFNNEASRPICIAEARDAPAWSPAVDIYETDVDIVLKAEVPGIDEKKIIVELKGNTLILKGERRLRKNLKKENFHRIERFYGAFQRHFNLPNTIIDSDKMRADCNDGVLKVIIPKKEGKNKKTIKVDLDHHGKNNE